MVQLVHLLYRLHPLLSHPVFCQFLYFCQFFRIISNSFVRNVIGIIKLLLDALIKILFDFFLGIFFRDF